MHYLFFSSYVLIFKLKLINLYLCRSRRLSTDSRYSSYGVVKNRKEVRPLAEKDFQQAAIYKVWNIIKYF